jgi:hypothetical protein
MVNPQHEYRVSGIHPQAPFGRILHESLKRIVVLFLRFCEKTSCNICLSVRDWQKEILRARKIEKKIVTSASLFSLPLSPPSPVWPISPRSVGQSVGVPPPLRCTLTCGKNDFLQSRRMLLFLEGGSGKVVW